MLKGRFQSPSRQIVVYGEPVSTALSAALKELWVGQAIIATDSDISEHDALPFRLADGLGSVCTDRVAGLRATANRNDAIRVAGALRAKGTEAVIAVGSGAVIETVKAARICLTNNVGDVADMKRLKRATTAATPRPYLVAVPTTLAGSNFAQYSLVLDEEESNMDLFYHQDLAPDVVILDPEATLKTPRDIWLDTGLTALVRAAETLLSSTPAPYGDATASYALSLLVVGLRGSTEAPEDLEARQNCQVGAWMSAQGRSVGLAQGAAERLAQEIQLLAGVPVGTSAAILLPRSTGDGSENLSRRSASVVAAFGNENVDLAGALRKWLGQLGMPNTLRQTGVTRADLKEAARKSALPRGLRDSSEIRDHEHALAILEAAF